MLEIIDPLKPVLPQLTMLLMRGYLLGTYYKKLEPSIGNSISESSFSAFF
jgi:hypothetical protein